ncbi:UDP-3-O-acyl-N-acetylglucosamine deacetylase [Candidatus Tokpelaia sp.]|uniref:UDP-3-O-acyl-N-acetylglucosamine deacetylase n=1 Tax=Candidatus Tokpelaia sp. TaxID=2233777 RepID=UPI00123B8986|nr:UDP-3-O-acyl-N-acetylglucosamine deacetylase [Candidatus Tokpelaia sp.]
MQVFQTTLKRSIRLEGIGVHSGAATVVTLHPAPVNHGIIFARYDRQGRPVHFPALSRYSRPADLCTVLTAEGEQKGEGLRVETIEHIMAALSACGLDNVLAEVSAGEVPILDGSAAPYMAALAAAGIEEQSAKRHYLRIIRPVAVKAERGAGFAEFCPLGFGAAPAQLFAVEIDFAAKAIGRQKLEFALTPRYFTDNLAAARTFGFLAEAEKLRALGLAQGADEENSVVIDANGAVMNPQALTAPDAFVRHKALDAVGDTALLGHPFIGLFRSYLGGHRLNSAAVKALLADKTAYEIIELTENRQA